MSGVPPKDTRFKPGQSGNPSGRKKGSKSFAGAMKRLLGAQKLDLVYTVNGKKIEKSIDIEGDYENFYDAIVAKQLEMAIGGDQRATDSIVNRIEGTPTQSINMKNEISGALSVNVDTRVINSRSEIKKTTTSEIQDNKTVESIVETVVNKSGIDFDTDEVF